MKINKSLIFAIIGILIFAILSLLALEVVGFHTKEVLGISETIVLSNIHDYTNLGITNVDNAFREMVAGLVFAFCAIILPILGIFFSEGIISKIIKFTSTGFITLAFIMLIAGVSSFISIDGIKHLFQTWSIVVIYLLVSFGFLTALSTNFVSIKW